MLNTFLIKRKLCNNGNDKDTKYQNDLKKTEPIQTFSIIAWLIGGQLKKLQETLIIRQYMTTYANFFIIYLLKKLGLKLRLI